MPQYITVRSSDLTRTIAEVDLQTARGMITRGEAAWTGSSRSIRLSTIEKQSQPVCLFPAQDLRSYRAAIMERARRLEAPESHGIEISAEARLHIETLQRIDQLRTAHEDIFGCRCWYTPAEIERDGMARNSGSDQTAVNAVETRRGPVNDFRGAL